MFAADDVQVAAGQTALLPCHTTLSTPVTWRYKSPLQPISTVIFSDKSILPSLRDRYSVDSSVSGRYDLQIKQVSTSDSGTYNCTEDEGFGKVVYTGSLVVYGMLL